MKPDQHCSQARAYLQGFSPQPGEALALLRKANVGGTDCHAVFELRAGAYALLCDFCSAVLNLQKSAACAGEGTLSDMNPILLLASSMLDAQALSLLASGSIELAENMLAAATAADKLNTVACFHRAVVQFQLKRYHEAVVSIGSAMHIAPHDPRLYLLRAAVHWQTKNFSHAAQDVADGLAIRRLPELVALGEDLRAQVKRGHLQYRGIQMQNVDRANIFAAQSDDNYAQGTEFMIQKLWSKALVCLKIACAMDPASGLKLMRKGVCRRYCGETAGAAEDLWNAFHLLSADGAKRESRQQISTTKAQLAISLNQLGMDSFEAKVCRQLYNTIDSFRQPDLIYTLMSRFVVIAR